MAAQREKPWKVFHEERTTEMCKHFLKTVDHELPLPPNVMLPESVVEDSSLKNIFLILIETVDKIQN